jgi:hypothetical protein
MLDFYNKEKATPKGMANLPTYNEPRKPYAVRPAIILLATSGASCFSPPVKVSV